MNLIFKIILIQLIASSGFYFSKDDNTKLEKENPPNIIYILTDDLGYGDISVFNLNGKIKTPNIANLAKEGMMFTDTHTSSSVCIPTRYGILTGRYNWRLTLKNGVLTGKSKALIPNSRTTIASMLKKQGYQTAFIVKWPDHIAANSKSDQTICTTDFMATAAEISGYQLKDNEAEDSFSMLPLLNGPFTGNSFRAATVHHSINGSFAIRKGDFKLIMCPDSGGWSYPQPGKDNTIIASLPKMQLFNLKSDPGEQHNLINSYPEKVEELKQLLNKTIVEVRSTRGTKQQNDTGNS